MADPIFTAAVHSLCQKATMAVNAVSINAENVDRAIEEVKHAEAALAELRKKLTEKKKEAAGEKVAKKVDDGKVNRAYGDLQNAKRKKDGIPIKRANESLLNAATIDFVMVLERLKNELNSDEVKSLAKMCSAIITSPTKDGMLDAIRTKMIGSKHDRLPDFRNPLTGELE